MCRNKGFTLIEVMVVLSILALIAILAYNFFGSTMKEARATQGAVKIYNDLRTLSDAMELYYQKNGQWPADFNSDDPASQLATSGILKTMPIQEIPGAASEGYRYHYDYDNMDGIGNNDGTLTTYMSQPLEVCTEFNKRYAAPPLNDGTIFDYEAAGNKYPGEIIGKSQRVYAIKWQTADTECEINWVMQYND